MLKAIDEWTAILGLIPARSFRVTARVPFHSLLSDNSFSAGQAADDLRRRDKLARVALRVVGDVAEKAKDVYWQGRAADSPRIEERVLPFPPWQPTRHRSPDATAAPVKSATRPGSSTIFFPQPAFASIDVVRQALDRAHQERDPTALRNQSLAR